MSTDEEQHLRYDRQVRLWGGAAQRALQECAAVIVGLSGAAGEFAKNCALCGLGAITVCDGTEVTAADGEATHLLRQSAEGRPAVEMSRAAVFSEALQRLNPFVRVSTTPSSPTRPRVSDAICGRWIAGATTALIVVNQPLSDLDELFAGLGTATGQLQGPRTCQHLLTINQCGPLALCTVMRVARGPAGADTTAADVASLWRNLLHDRVSLSRRPMTFQLAVLLLHATARSGTPQSEGRSFRRASSTALSPAVAAPERLAVLLELAAELCLTNLGASEIQLAFDILTEQRGHSMRSDINACSVVGGIVSQQLVASLSCDAPCSDGPAMHPHLWSLHSMLPDRIETLVGDE